MDRPRLPRYLAAIWVLLCLGAGPDTGAQLLNLHYNFKRLNVQNGLTQNIVYHFLQDSRGYLWIGTRKGLTRFDGVRTINYTHDDGQPGSLGGDFITRILEDSSHRLWIGQDRGIDRYDRLRNIFIHYRLGSPAARDVFCVPLGFAGPDQLWFLDMGAHTLRVLDTRHDSVRTLLATDAVDGTVWYDSLAETLHVWTYLSRGTRHYLFRGGRLERQEQFFGPAAPGRQPQWEIFHVLPQSAGCVWLSTSAGLVRLNPGRGTWKLYHRIGTTRLEQVRCCEPGERGLLWLGTGQDGIYTFDPATERLVDHFRYLDADAFSLCSNNIVSIYLDHLGNIWCGSYGSGLSYSQVSGNRFAKYLSRTEMAKWQQSNNVTWVAEAPGMETWCLVQDAPGYWVLDSGLRVQAHRVPRMPDGKPFSGSLYQFLFDGQDLAWCLTDRGLYRYDRRSNRLTLVPYPRLSDQLFGSYWTNRMIRLHDSSLLLGTFSGLYRITGSIRHPRIEPFSPLNQLTDRSFDELYEDADHDIWVKDHLSRLYRLSSPGDTGRCRVLQRFYLPAEVSQFALDSQRRVLWIATNNGLYALSKSDFRLRRVNPGGGQPVGALAALLLDRGRLLLFGERGLYLADSSLGTGTLFTTEDGLCSSEFNPSALVPAGRGRWLAGTTNGLLAFHPGDLQAAGSQPRAELTGLFINDSAASMAANIQETARLSLEPGQNTFSLSFAPIAFQHAADCRYEYRLENYDAGWIRGVAGHGTRYSRIPPGDYVFRLRVLDAAGRVSPFEKALALTIRRAFWQTTWFRLLAAGLVLAAGFFLLRWYLRASLRKRQLAYERRQAIERERTRIATDMHDDLGAGLSRIKFLSETIGLKKQQQEPIEEDINRIREYSHEMIDKMGEIVWALNEKNDSLSDLLAYTRSYAVEYLSEHGIACRVDQPDLQAEHFVSGEFRRNIYLTVKEALHNVVKHARASRVEILVRAGRTLDILIRDDGTGFNPAEVRPFRNGLSNMRRRIQEIGGVLQVTASAGTEVSLSVPLPG
ncbi:MAG TPA: two-component regulator propeller domain-containing protein [Chitinophagaceae bacterium]|nr:two-component regulator propeller domain-containing protein [Chitinophagaceae bacterium]